MKTIAKQVLELIDLTSLNDNDNESVILELCKNAKNDYGNVPAVCVYSRFIPIAKKTLNQSYPNIKIATVVNFPHGSSDIELVLYETKLAVDRGADEIDLVFPYHYFKNNELQVCHDMISQVKQICGSKTLKVILETGELKTPELIKNASEMSIKNGADFIKTSTGKVSVNATLESAEIMLNAIKSSNKKCGFKASGGIKTVNEAKQYLELATKIMGAEWLNSNNFRFGASSLLNDVLRCLSDNTSQTTN